MTGLNWRGKIINGISHYRAYYDKGIMVLSVLRNMQITDLGILMGVCKYLFGDHISTSTIIIIGAVYWVFNVIVNLSVGWFWEKNNGWEIEAQVFGKRTQPSRTVLVDPDGKSYGPRDIGGQIYKYLITGVKHGKRAG